MLEDYVGIITKNNSYLDLCRLELWEFELVTFASIIQFISDRDYKLYCITLPYKQDKESFAESKKRLEAESKIKNKSLLEKYNNAENVINKFQKLGGE